MATEMSWRDILKAIRGVCRQLDAASSERHILGAPFVYPENMLADVMSALYSSLNTALVANELENSRGGSGRGGEVSVVTEEESHTDSAATECVVEVRGIFKVERLIFSGGGRGGVGKVKVQNGGSGVGAMNGWLVAAKSAPPQPVVLRVTDCVWDESLAGAVCGLFPLRTIFSSMRPFFVEILDVPVGGLPLAFRALKTLSEKPWPLVQDRLERLAAPHLSASPLSSFFEACVALYKEIDLLLLPSRELVLVGGGGGSSGHDGAGGESRCGSQNQDSSKSNTTFVCSYECCTGCQSPECRASQMLRTVAISNDDVFLLSTCRGRGSGHIMQMVACNKVSVYIDDDDDLARRLDKCFIGRNFVWVASRRWTSGVAIISLFYCFCSPPPSSSSSSSLHLM